MLLEKHGHALRYTLQNITYRPQFSVGRIYTSFVPLSISSCSIPRVGWAEVGSQSTSVVSCLFLLVQSSYWLQCFRRRAPRALTSSGGGGAWGGGKNNVSFDFFILFLLFSLGGGPLSSFTRLCKKSAVSLERLFWNASITARNT